MSEEISDEELKTEIESILKDADLAKTYTRHVIQKLEKKLGIELKHRKNAIDKMVMDYVNSQDSSASEEEEKASEKSEEEEEEKSPISEEEEEEERPKKRKKKGSDDSKKAAKPKAKKGGGGGRGKGSGYTRAYKLSPALADLMGKESMPRHEVVKRVWEIIKSKNLYDQNNKQFAICDDALYKVIGTKRFRIFGMMKYLKTHFLDD
ncbi:hypothetical protein O0L34_g6435 [Tuta absoluta]|nr:hypothetical protein O0L34_g14100 [Tuta absoluta]KAJ2940503.1 hypothetical protein O0L34_g6435 [Tuta absoluta]